MAAKRQEASEQGAAPGQCRLRYFGVADYQTQEAKLADIAIATLRSVPWRTLAPNDEGDWLNQRGSEFVNYPCLVARAGSHGGDSAGHFDLHSLGVATNRDAWCWNFSRSREDGNMRKMIASYNRQLSLTADGLPVDRDPTQVSWTDLLLRDASRGVRHAFVEGAIRVGSYRPFCQQNLYFDRSMNHRVYRMPQMFPTPHHENRGFAVIESGARAPFSVLMTGALPDSKMYVDAAQFFPRWTYEKATDGDQSSLLEATASEGDEWGYRRVDNITDDILALYRQKFGSQVSKDDVFYYVYGVLHSEQYRTTFAADLKRMLPRIPLAATASDFEAFVDAGRRLADLHVNYASVEPYPLHEPSVAGLGDWVAYRVEKMRWADKTTKKAIVYNAHVTLGDIPAAAHRYMLGSRSALEWLIDRYQVKTDKASGIVNDPNDWCREHDQPRYIVDLIKRVTRVSVDTMAIVDALPELPLG